MTIKEMFEFQVIIGRKLIDQERLLLSTIELLDNMGNCYAEMIPNLPPETREMLHSIHARSDTTRDQLAAAQREFAATFGEYSKIKFE